MIYIGCSGYYFKDWSPVFYPADLDKNLWLKYYAQSFKILEINTTYYGVPKLSTVENWNKQTPEDFRFFIKIHGDFTHKRDGLEGFKDFYEKLSPLVENNKLYGFLAQFPASFKYNETSIEYLKKFASLLDNASIYIELRHSSWDTNACIELMRELGLGWVIVDQPNHSSLMQTRLAVTNSTAYIRFHGRNFKNWYNPDRGDRYDWDYSEQELKQWLPRLKALENRAEISYLFFNNCHAGQAIKSAFRMREILEKQFEVF